MDSKTFVVKGFVKIYSGNQMDFLDRKPIYKKTYKVIAVEGIHRHDGSPFFDIKSLNSQFKIIKTNFHGEFDVELNPGVYTFFILKGDKVYLNNFDGFGNYSHIKVKNNIENIIIKDDQNAYF